MKRNNWISPTKSYTQDANLRYLCHGPVQPLPDSYYEQPPLKPWIMTALVLSLIVVVGVYYAYSN